MGTPDEPRRLSRRSYAAALCFGGRKSPFGGVLGEHARPVQNRQRRVGSAQHHDLGFHVVTAVAIGRNLQLHRLEAHAVVLAHRALETRAQDVSQRWADPGHEGAAVRASLPCSFGTERGGLRVRGRRGCRHRTGPVRVGFAGRTSPSAPGRSSHRAFFRAPHKGDDTRPWITEDTAHRGERTKTREAIRIPERPLSLEGSSHANMCAVSSPLANPEGPLSTRLRRRFMPSFHPHDCLKTQESMRMRWRRC